MPKDGGQAKSADALKAARVVRFVAENYNGKMSLTDLAETLQISTSYLSESFKQVTGTGFSHYVAQRRFDEACHLLRAQPGTSITEIAFRVGFQCLPQFNRVFKRLSGKSPRQYRKTLGEGQIAQPIRRSKLEIAKLVCESRKLRHRTEKNLERAREWLCDLNRISAAL